MSTLLSIESLHKSYADKCVLEDINLQVHAGQILGLVGANGAGKTSCLQAILGLIQYKGNINVAGFNPKKHRAHMLNDVAYIADVAVLPKWMKVNHCLEYMHGVHPNFDIAKANAFLQKTNIPINAKIKSLSKGMVTQLHLALVLAVDAKVLILDEPTLGLDILTRRTFYHHLLEDFFNEQKCIIITTHQIDEIENLLTHVAFIKEGRLVLNESTENLNKRFTLLQVNPSQRQHLESLAPVSQQTLLGMTTALIDRTACTNDQLENICEIGELHTPSLSDIFVGLMDKENEK